MSLITTQYCGQSVVWKFWTKNFMLTSAYDELRSAFYLFHTLFDGMQKAWFIIFIKIEWLDIFFQNRRPWWWSNLMVLRASHYSSVIQDSEKLSLTINTLNNKPLRGLVSVWKGNFGTGISCLFYWPFWLAENRLSS